MNNLTFRRHSRRGTALLLVVVFAAILMLLAAAFHRNFSNTIKRTESFVDTARALFAARAAEQLALLKFREITTDFYFAKQRSEVGINPTKPINNPLTWFKVPINDHNMPLSEFKDDLSGWFRPTGDRLTAATAPGTASTYDATFDVYSMHIISSTQYQTDALVIRATARYARRDGKAVTRDFESVVRLDRLQ